MIGRVGRIINTPVAAREFDKKTLSRLHKLGALESLAKIGTFDSQRDSVARALPKIGEVDWWTDGEDWEGALAQVSPPRKGKKFQYMDSNGYLFHCQAIAEARAAGYVGAGEIAIVGGLVVGELPARRALQGKSLPRAIVIGDAEMVECPGLESIDLVVLGNLTVRNCPKLQKVEGEVFGSAEIANCGLTGIGANFRVAQDMDLHGCPELRVVNCEVGGMYLSSRCGEVRFGPAFSSKNRADVLRSSGLARLERQGALKNGIVVGRTGAVQPAGGNKSRGGR